jgi:hypothetical protein
VRALVAVYTVAVGVLVGPENIPVWLVLVAAVVGVCVWTDRDTSDG